MRIFTCKAFVFFIQFLFSISLISCLASKDMSGKFKVTEGKFQSDSMTIKKIDNNNYEIEFVDQLSRGNKPIKIPAVRNDNILNFKYGTMSVQAKFDDGLNEFTFVAYGITFKCERDD